MDCPAMESRASGCRCGGLSPRAAPGAGVGVATACWGACAAGQVVATLGLARMHMPGISVRSGNCVHPRSTETRLCWHLIRGLDWYPGLNQAGYFPDSALSIAEDRER